MTTESILGRLPSEPLPGRQPGIRPEAGTRQRRRETTRLNLRKAAVQLFSSRGYSPTTVAAIADAADVSERSFYRYFPSKEAVALEEFRAFIDSSLEFVRSRPATEHPVDSILAVIDHLETQKFDDTLYLDFSLTLNHSEVAGAQRSMSIGSQDAMTDLFAQRLECPADDLEPRLLASCATLAFDSALLTWRRRIEAGKSEVNVWDLARQSVQACADGLRRIPN